MPETATVPLECLQCIPPPRSPSSPSGVPFGLVRPIFYEQLFIDSGMGRPTGWMRQ
jgi:hypothetical protein